MGCSLFSNSHFQMGVTVMGFEELFGHSQLLQITRLMNLWFELPEKTKDTVSFEPRAVRNP